MKIPYKLVLLSIGMSTLFFVVGLYLPAHAQSKYALSHDVPATNTLDSSKSVHHRDKADVFHLDKERASEYKTINPSYYEGSGILGTSAAFLVIILLVWVYYQNYAYYKRTKQGK